LVHFGHQANSLCSREQEVLTLVAEVRASLRQHG
jgi:hypothetical protein